jgi:hypothetical protein
MGRGGTNDTSTPPRKPRAKDPLSVTHPEIAGQFVRAAEGFAGKSPANVTRGSDAMFFWRCPKGHEWRTQVLKRTVRGQGCPVCSGRVATQATCIATTHPEIAAQFVRPAASFEGKDPSSVKRGSGAVFWWRCSQGHEWKAEVHRRALRGQGCPVCAGRVVSEETCLASVQPEIAAQFLRPSKSHEGKDPTTVTRASSAVFWWRCREGHEWKAPVNARSKGYGCPVCSSRVVVDETCIAATDPAIADQFTRAAQGHKGKDPTTVSRGSKAIFWWRCPVASCRHEWRATVNDRTSGYGCPSCSSRVATSKTCLAATHPEITAQFVRAADGHIDKAPTNVTAGSGAEFWWRCAEGHEWKATVRGRTIGRGCLVCNRVGWTLPKARFFLADAWPELRQLSHSARQERLQSEGLLTGQGVGRTLATIVAVGLLDDAEIANYLGGSGSPAVDELLAAHDPRSYGGRKHIPQAVRERVYRRDDHQCQACGSHEDLSLDHIRPVSLGGNDHEDNLQTLCMDCNLTKRAKILTIEELRAARGADTATPIAA